MVAGSVSVATHLASNGGKYYVMMTKWIWRDGLCSNAADYRR
jgi:hypothetical protein